MVHYNMRNAGSCFEWEVKLVNYVQNTLVKTRFVSFRMDEVQKMYSDLDQFLSLEVYRDRLNKMIRFTELIYDVSGELLAHADTLGRASVSIYGPEAPGLNEDDL